MCLDTMEFQRNVTKVPANRPKLLVRLILIDCQSRGILPIAGNCSLLAPYDKSIFVFICTPIALSQIALDHKRAT